MKTVKLTTNKQVKAFCDKMGVKYGKTNWTKCTEHADAFGSFTTYYSGNTPTMQQDIYADKVDVFGLIDFQPVKKKKTQIDFQPVDADDIDFQPIGEKTNQFSAEPTANDLDIYRRMGLQEYRAPDGTPYDLTGRKPVDLASMKMAFSSMAQGLT